MPNYDFRCLACSHEYEERVAFSEREKVACPKCGSKEKQQLFKAGAVKGPVAGSAGTNGSFGCGGSSALGGCGSGTGFT
ncbi:FmdB family zinc ribbon protein [Effusibacillus lacus]|uniref:Putative regulatory protein FmdB zinc ribbon domain-containing protein n=1 Tax=Effusibacillus lacus TaxID=1348429 RepID=A0A292YEA4_9BACL|nr:zinc ribbon domain-containing protein [Effusibacillus lacus]TCS76972.1 putative FmdB family regulatory protein [Effusibacillus lacus]GAX91302.1 hypothetical protein EFBL_2968 [Effusibacillus lacus]